MKTVTINPGVFNAILLAVLGKSTEWGGEDHSKFFTALRSHFKDEDGNEVKFTEPQVDRLMLIVRQTETLQRRVLKQTLEEAGYTLDETTTGVFDLLMSASQLSDFLSKSVNPKTGKPFIVKKKKRGAKKSTFASLIAPTPPVVEPVQVETAPQTEEPPAEAEVSKTTDMLAEQAPPAPAKGGAKN